MSKKNINNKTKESELVVNGCKVRLFFYNQSNSDSINKIKKVLIHSVTLYAS